MQNEPSIQRAVKHHVAGELDQAEAMYRQLLAANNEDALATHNLGTLLVVKGQHKEGLQLIKAALQLDPRNADFCASLAESLLFTGRIDEAAQVTREAKLASLGTRRIDDLQQQARLRSPSAQERQTTSDLFTAGRFAETQTAGLEFIKRFPEHFYGWQVLATALHAQGRIDEALAAIKQAHTLAPENGSVLNTLGVMLKLTGQLAAAETTLVEATKLLPNHDKAHSNLGAVYLHTGRFSLAEAALRSATRLAPLSAEAHNNLGAALRELGRFAEAEHELTEALRLTPGYADAWSNLGVVYRETGRLADCVTAYQKALTLEPRNWNGFSNLLFAQNFISGIRPQQSLLQAKHFGESVSAQVEERFTFPNRTPHQPLRIGFVSGDLRDHVVSYFLEGVLAKLDRTKYALYAYSSNPLADEVTERLKSYFALWQPIYGMDDVAAARLIHNDAIDILFDLSGHTAHNRMALFARKPAPVQISWLGYFATTGLAQIDYILADAVSVPEQHRSHFIEKIWTLPSTRLLFTPPVDAPDVAPLPAATRGHITFGTFQSLTKVQDAVLRLWAQVMQRLPDSTLRAQCRQFTDAAIRRQVSLRLEAAGIPPNRVSLLAPVHRLHYLQAHAEIDMILDTFPFPGGTTTCEALWMGVPTLTLCGDCMISRQGASLMTAAGLPDWVVQTEAEFVERAVFFGRNIEYLIRLRSNLREQCSDSSLCDSSKFTENFERALEEIWAQSTLAG